MSKEAFSHFSAGVYLSVLAPRMVTVAHPGTAELVAAAGWLVAGMCDRVMISVTVFASALQNPAALSRNVEEGFA